MIALGRTRRDILTSILPNLLAGDVRTQSTTRSTSAIRPTEVRVWAADVWAGGIAALLAINPDERLQDCDIKAVLGEPRDEANIVQTFHVNVTRIVNNLMAGQAINTPLQADNAVARSMDFACMSITPHRRLYAAGEMKPFWRLGHRDIFGPWNMNMRSVIHSAISQLVGYMCIQNICFGMLTSYNSTYFVHAVQAGPIVEIHGPIDSSSGQLISSIVYFMMAAQDDVSPFPPHAAVVCRSTRLAASSDDVEDATVEGEAGATGLREIIISSSSSSICGKRKRRVSGVTDRENDSDDSFSTDPEEPVLFHDVVLGEVLGEGRMGCVWSCLWDDITAAVKIVDVSKTGAQSLDKERDRYRELSHLQGVCIPRIFSYSFGADIGIIDGFVMQKLKPMPDDFEDWRDCDRTAANSAIRLLKQRTGLVQGDMRGANFGLDEVTGRIMLLDLEDLQKIRRHVPYVE
jgi:hypothetical protein